MNKGRNAYRVLDGKSEVKMALGRSRQTLVLILTLNRQMGHVVHQLHILFE
jgi:hypothetical protein